MKKNKVNLSRLVLKKETISVLKAAEMDQMLGGREESSSNAALMTSVPCGTQPPASKGVLCQAIGDGIVDGILSALSGC